MLRKIFGLNRDLMVESWSSLHNEKLINLYFSSKIIRFMKSRRMSWADHVVRVEEKRNEETVLVGKLERKRPRRRWKDSMKMISKKRPRRRWKNSMKMVSKKKGKTEPDLI
jgi:hypothetical protein